jgi:hypothetical protein
MEIEIKDEVLTIKSTNVCDDLKFKNITIKEVKLITSCDKEINFTSDKA